MSVSVSVCGSRSIPIPTFLFRCSLGGLIPRQLLFITFCLHYLSNLFIFICPLDLFSFIFILTLFQRGYLFQVTLSIPSLSFYLIPFQKYLGCLAPTLSHYTHTITHCSIVYVLFPQTAIKNRERDSRIKIET